MRRLVLILLACLAAALAVARAQEPGDDPPVEVSVPLVSIAGRPATLEFQAVGPAGPEALRVEVRDGGGRSLGGAVLGSDGAGGLEIVAPAGTARYTLHAAGHPGSVAFSVRGIPGWLTLLPPALAILTALLFRQVVPALLAGIWVGAWIAFGGPLTGTVQTIDRYLMQELVDRDHMYILVFSMLLGGMVGIISRSGGTAGLVDVLSRRATDSRRGQFFTWLLGLVIFFDDYANTLVVGNTMRPVTDKLRISREKLAYIVDSTAAPVASLALISTWIGFQLGLIADSLEDMGSQQDAYWVFVQSIPYGFYPIVALSMVFLVGFLRRDFGPMLAAERRAAAGQVLAATAEPLSSFDHQDLNPDDGQPQRWYNALIPVLTVLAVTFGSQYAQGRAALVESGHELAGVGLFGLGLEGLGTLFAGGDSFRSLLYGAFSGCLMAILLALGQRILRLDAALRAWVEGMKTMFLAFVILALAWGIGAVCTDLGTADFIVTVLEGRLHPGLLPMLIFVFAAIIAFSTGSSWSTMSILIPLAVPSAFTLAQNAGWAQADMQRILLGSVASVLAGAIFGDHCSPISDTTVLSSMASGCDHVDHVRTQLPYALLAAGIAVLAGSIPNGFGVPVWICLPVALGALVLALRLVGRPAAAS